MGRYRRYLIALAVVVVVLGAYAAAGFWAVPHFARSQPHSFAKTHWGRAVAVGEIRFNPFTLNLDVSQFSLPDADGKTLLSFEHLTGGPAVGEPLAPRSELWPDPAAEAVRARGHPPRRRAESRRPRQGLSRGAAAAADQKAKPLRLYIGRLAVTDGATAFEDRTRPTPFAAQLTPIDFELRDFSTIGGKGNAYQLEAASPAGRTPEVDRHARAHPAVLARRLRDHRGARRTTLWTYLRDSVPFEITSGDIAVRGTYELAADVGPLAVKRGRAERDHDAVRRAPQGRAAGLHRPCEARSAGHARRSRPSRRRHRESGALRRRHQGVAGCARAPEPDGACLPPGRDRAAAGAAGRARPPRCPGQRAPRRRPPAAIPRPGR